MQIRHATKNTERLMIEISRDLILIAMPNGSG